MSTIYIEQERKVTESKDASCMQCTLLAVNAVASIGDLVISVSMRF